MDQITQLAITLPPTAELQTVVSKSASSSNFYVYVYLREKDSDQGKAGTPYYIGKGKGRRAKCIQRRFSKPTNADNLVLAAGGMTEPDAFQLEMLLIHLHGRISTGTGCLRNLTDGGEGISGFKHSAESKRKVWENRSEEDKEKLRTSAKRIVYTPELRKHLSETHKGIYPSAESVEKRRQAMLGRTQTEEHVRKRMETKRRNGFKRASVSEETRMKMSLASKGRKKSAETKAKMSEALRRRVRTEEELERLRNLQVGRRASTETRKKMSISRTGKKIGTLAERAATQAAKRDAE